MIYPLGLNGSLDLEPPYVICTRLEHLSSRFDEPALSCNSSCGSLKLQIFAANILGLGALKKCGFRISLFLDSLLWGHKGPRFGIEEAREILGVFGCPLAATSVKPKLSLDAYETVAICRSSGAGQAGHG